MEIAAALSIAVMAGFVLLVLLYAAVFFFSADRLPYLKDKDITILVAARDEEAAILDCLRALAALDYPRERMQVLIGDDGSTDRTAELVQAFIADRDWMHYRKIEKVLPGMKGKQNVLAQLAHAATGEVILITDADIQVHRDWAAGMVGAFADAKTGVACGSTAVWGKGLFARAQGLDWMMGLVLARAHAVLGMPITALGNNMAVRRVAYEQAGGYEAMPFSIVEDYLLFHMLCERGPWKFAQRFDVGVSAISLPLEDARAWMRQRKRWFKGAKGLAWYNVVLIFFNALVLPAIVVAGFSLSWLWALVFLGVKLLGDFLLLWLGTQRLDRLGWLRWFGPYWLYYLVALVVTPILTILPVQVIWKGRKY